MKNTLLYIFTLAICFNSYSQSQVASISVVGETQKRIDKYSKTYKIRKRHQTSPLPDVDIRVTDSHKKVILVSKSDGLGKYKLDFHLDPNQSYTVAFTKSGYYVKKYLFNTNGISLEKHIEFHHFDFYLYKRVIGLNDSVFVEPTIFYYDSERGYMTYDEAFNNVLAVAQEKLYIDYLRNLNETNFTINEIDPSEQIFDQEYKPSTTIDSSKVQSELPKFELINMKELLESMSIHNLDIHDSTLTKNEKEITGKWQKLEIAKSKAITTEEKTKIAEAEKMLLDLEEQIIKSKIENEKSKKLLELQLVENKSKNNLIKLGSFALAIMLVLLFFVFRNNQERIRVNSLLTLKNKEVVDSIKYAKRIQNAILPPTTTIKKHLPNSFILYNPKDIVSGDFYWVENVGDKVLFAVIDCTGHGVPGAFMSIVSHNALNHAVDLKNNKTPADILNDVHLSISNTLHQAENIDVEDGMDISLCMLDTKTLELQFSGAYHPLYVVRDGELLITKSQKYSIGSNKGKGKTYNNNVFKTMKNDTIYIFSDGFVDQFGGPNGKKFMHKRFKELLLSIQNDEMNTQKEIINATFDEWKGNLEQIDDICLMGVKI